MAWALVVWAAWRLPIQSGQMMVKADPEQAQLSIGAVLGRPEVRWFFVSIFLTVLAHSSIYAFFSLYLVELGFGKQVVGMLWAVSIVVEIIWFAFQGRMLERGTLHHWLIGAALLTALRFAMIVGGGTSLLILVLAQCLHAITFAAQHTACIALITRYFPGRLRGRGQALYSVMGYGLSGVVGSIGGGWLVASLGYQALFIAAIAAALASALCAWQSRRLDSTAIG